MNIQHAVPLQTIKPDWPNEFSQASSATSVATAESFLQVWQSFSRPAEFLCSDGNRYVLKAIRSDLDISKQIFTDQVIARVGSLIGAPVGEAALIELPQELININPEISHMCPGLAHATRRILNVSERVDAISYADKTENKSRYSALVILYWWVGAHGDRQFVYGTNEPFLVYSVDHGHFFPGGPNWTSEGLDTAPLASQPASDIMGQCGLTMADLNAPISALLEVTAADIAGCVMASPQGWVTSASERQAVADFLWRQRHEILTVHNAATAVAP